MIVLLVQSFALNRFEDHVLSGAKHNAKTTADGVLNGLNMLMINGIISDAAQRALYVEKMAASEKVTELRVFRGKAVIDQYGAGLPAEQATDALDNATLDTAKIQIQQSKQDDRYALRVVVPFSTISCCPNLILREGPSVRKTIRVGTCSDRPRTLAAYAPVGCRRTA